MPWDDDDGEDFNWDNLSEEEKAAIDREIKEEEKRMLNHPLYKQACEILNTVNAIIESLPEEDRDFHSPMLESACILAPKFAGAFECDDWLITMQNAALMRYHAAYIATGTYGFEMHGEVDMRYVRILREEMESYKKSFNAWMKEIHAMPRTEMDVDDEWGVFVR